MKKLAQGLYSHTHTDGALFRVTYIEELKSWNWHNINGKEYGEPVKTKRECVAALMDYLAHRVYDKQWGWIYE